MKNKWHILGLITILGLFIISLTAHWVVPDKSFNANYGSEFLANKPPLFSVKKLILNENTQTNTRAGIDYVFLYGRSQNYTTIPISGEPKIEGNTLFFNIYPSYINISSLAIPLIEVIKSIYPDFSRKLSYKLRNKNYIYTSDSVYFLNLREEKEVISKKDLINIFWNKHIKTQTYYLGTDESGRDLLSRTVYGIRKSILIAIGATLIAIFGGGLCVLINYFFKKQNIRLIEWSFAILKYVFPIFMVIISAFVVEPSNLTALILSIGMALIPSIFFKINTMLEQTSQIPYIKSIVSFGFSEKKIFSDYIFPKIINYLWVVLLITVNECLIYECFLSFMNLSLPDNIPTLGNLINSGLNHIGQANYAHLILAPTISIIIIRFGFYGILQMLRNKTLAEVF